MTANISQRIMFFEYYSVCSVISLALIGPEGDKGFAGGVGVCLVCEIELKGSWTCI